MENKNNLAEDTSGNQAITNPETVEMVEPKETKPGLVTHIKTYGGLIAVLVLAVYFLFDVNVSIKGKPFMSDFLGLGKDAGLAKLEKIVLPSEGVVFPARWGDVGKKMVAAGVIDAKKFEDLYASRGGLSDEAKAFLYGDGNGNLKITADNSGEILNLLWALGLGQKNTILEKGPMTDPKYGGAGGFASTGGWTLAKGGAMNHYSKHLFFKLTYEQQKFVENVSKNIFRPCCGNSTYFPDCNHGMAMLGLLELMASQGVGEADMYKAALAANSYWFPDTYLTIAKYMDMKGVKWNKVDPKSVLGANFSSATGYRKILQQVTPPDTKSGGGCGV